MSGPGSHYYAAVDRVISYDDSTLAELRFKLARTTWEEESLSMKASAVFVLLTSVLSIPVQVHFGFAIPIWIGIAVSTIVLIGKFLRVRQLKGKMDLLLVAIIQES